MILATHAVAGAAVGSLLPTHPVLGFGLGFASHFALDALPHWDYKLASAKTDKTNPLNFDLSIDRRFLFDLAKISLDLLLGFGLVYLFLQPSERLWVWVLYLGALGGVLPDFLQFAYFKIRSRGLELLQRFHLWIHTSYRLQNPILGIGLQAGLVVAIILIVYYS